MALQFNDPNKNRRKIVDEVIRPVYEAGYAKGQEKVVIHTCYKEWFTTSGVHFDVNALNLIIYDDNNNDLAIKLRKRIRETGNIKAK